MFTLFTIALTIVGVIAMASVFFALIIVAGELSPQDDSKGQS